MRVGEPVLFHSRLSGPLKLHLLSPAEVVEAALANPAGAPLNSVEGFVRQVIGWREFVRGVYWRFMPGYAERNALGADLPAPRFYWTGETDMRCLAEAVRHTLDHAYAHHIERLMVLGLSRRKPQGRDKPGTLLVVLRRRPCYGARNARPFDQEGFR